MEEPPAAPIPESTDNQTDVPVPPAEPEEFQPQWWDHLRALVGAAASKPDQPEVREEAGAGQLVTPEAVEPAAPSVAAAGSNGKHLSSDEMFAVIGAELQARRMALDLTREEIERHIHVRAHYLQALEEGDFSGLPSAVQTRGMLSNYATFLDLNVDEILLRFADVLQVQHRERHPLPPGARGRVQPAAPANLPPLRGFIASDLLGVGFLVLMVMFTVWGISRVMQTRATAGVEPTSPSISDILLAATDLPSATPSATLSLLDLGGGNSTATPLAAEEPSTVPTFPQGITVQINLVVVERTYLRVIVDGKVAFDGRVAPGSAYPFDGQNRIEVLTGNGAALRVTYNLRDMGFLGSFGQVVDLVYTGGGVLTPTATISPTPTITFTPTITPSPTLTMVPTRVPSTATNVPRK